MIGLFPQASKQPIIPHEPRQADVGFPYLEAFLGLLLVYMVYSQWTRLDSRYPIAAALVLLVAAAVANAVGNLPIANNLATYAFFLLVAGVVLLVVDRVRESRTRKPSAALDRPPPRPEAPATDAANGGEPVTEQTFDRLEEELISRVKTSRQQNDEHEQSDDRESNQRKRPERRAESKPP